MPAAGLRSREGIGCCRVDADQSQRYYGDARDAGAQSPWAHPTQASETDRLLLATRWRSLVGRLEGGTTDLPAGREHLMSKLVCPTHSP